MKREILAIIIVCILIGTTFGTIVYGNDKKGEFKELQKQFLLNCFNNTANSLEKYIVELSEKHNLLPPIKNNKNPATDESLIVTLESNNYTIKNNIGGTNKIKMDEFGLILIPGCPRVPSKIFKVGLPPGKKVISIELINKSQEELMGEYNVEPSPPISNGFDEEEYNKNMLIYSSSDSYPSNVFEYLGMGQMRKYQFAQIRFNPVLYYPSEKRLVICKNISLKIYYEDDDNYLKYPLSDIVADDIASKKIVNFNFISRFYYLNTSGPSPVSNDDFDYLIIYSTTQAQQVSISFKGYLEDEKGYKVKIISFSNAIKKMTGRDNQEKLRKYLKGKSQANPNFKFALLIGAHDSIPMRICHPDSDLENSFTAKTDYYYADLSGNWDSDGDNRWGEIGEDAVNFDPEIWVGRIPFDDFSDISIFENTKKYETNSGDWKKRVLELGAILNYQNQDNTGWDKTDGAFLMEICWADIYNPNDYEQTRMYEAAGEDPTDCIYDYPLNKNNVLDSTNGWARGFGLVNIDSHGYTYFASRKVWTSDQNNNGIPEASEIDNPHFIESSDFPIDEDSMPPIVFFCTCDNAKPDDISNLALTVLKNDAAGCIASTTHGWYTIGWDEVDDGGVSTLDYLFFDELINKNKPLGQSLYSAKEYYYEHYDWRNWKTYANMYGFNVFGDPSLLASNLPDVAIKNLRFTKKPSVLESTTIKAEVWNTGNELVGINDINFLVDTNLLGTVSVSSPIPPGDYEEIEIDWTVKRNGEKRIIAVADAGGVIAERNELNNEKIIYVTIDPLFYLKTPSVRIRNDAVEPLILHLDLGLVIYGDYPLSYPNPLVSWEIRNMGYNGVMNLDTENTIDGMYYTYDAQTSISLDTGIYTIDFTIDIKDSYSESAYCQLDLVESTSQIYGTVTDEEGIPIENAQIDLEIRKSQYPWRETINTFNTGLSGYYYFDNLKPRQYHLSVSHPDYETPYRNWFNLVGGENYEDSFILSPNSVGRLCIEIENLYNALSSSIDYLADKLSYTTSKYDDIENPDDYIYWEILDWATFAISIYSGVRQAAPKGIPTPKDPQFWNFVEQCAQEGSKEINKKIIGIVSDTVIDNYLQYVYNGGKIDANTLKGMPAHTSILDSIQQAKTNLKDTLRTTSIDDEFDFNLAVSAVMEATRILEEELMVDNPKKDWSVNQDILLSFTNDKKCSGSGGVSSTQSYQFPRAFKAFMDKLNQVIVSENAKKAWSIIQFVVAVAVAVAVTVGTLGTGTPAAAALMAWGISSFAADRVINGVNAGLKSQFTNCALSCRTNYNFDVTTTLASSDSIKSTLENEITWPKYFDLTNDYSADITDLKVTIPGIQNQDIFLNNKLVGFTYKGNDFLKYLPDYQNLGDIIEKREATIKVTNTGSFKTDFYVFFYDNCASSINYKINDLMPGRDDERTIEFTPPPILPYTKNSMYYDTDYYINVEVYAGAYPVAKETESFKYLVYKEMFGNQRDGTKNGNYMVNQTEILNTQLNLSNPSTDIDYTVGENYSSVTFSILGSDNLDYFIYNEEGFCIGYNVTLGKVATEFPASYSQEGKNHRKFNIPGSAGKNYTIKVNLSRPYHLKNNYPIKIYATQIPFRPAILSIDNPFIKESTPSNATIPISVVLREMGGQRNIDNVTLSISNLSYDRYEIQGYTKFIGNISAGTIEPVSFDIHIPEGTPSGIYVGEIVANSSNTNSYAINVSVTVDNEIPFVILNSVLYEHGCSVSINETIALNVTVIDNFDISYVVVDTYGISTEDRIWFTRIGNTNYYTAYIFVDKMVYGKYYELPIFAIDMAGNINTTERILIRTDEINPTLYVGGTGPNNYTSIQDAINDATMEDIIFVYNGTYNEELHIDHRIGGLFGENKNSTVITSSSSYVTIWLCGYADKICIDGFTIKNGNNDGSAAIQIQHCDGILINNNIIDGNCHIGVWIYGNSSDNKIFDNDICNFTYGGICLHNCDLSNRLFRNEIYNNEDGIYTINSNNSIIFNNILRDNNWNAIDPCTNQWDNGEQGNYWDNFDEASEGAYDNNNDGIVDTPYDIPGGSNQDHYPLINSDSNPLANFNYTTYNLSVTFDGSFSHVNFGEIVCYEWQFGDGTTASGKYTTHTYPSYGDYNVNLTITDIYGKHNTISKKVSVFPIVDYIMITHESLIEISDCNISTNYTLPCYATSYNITYGYTRFIDGFWSIDNSGSNASINSTSGTNIIFNSGWHNGTTTLSVHDDKGHFDNVTFNINPSLFSKRVYQSWNLLTIPFDNGWSAETLGQNITGCTAVVMFNASTQTFLTHVVGVPHDDFPIVDGVGYFVYCTRDSILSMPDVAIPSVNVPIYWEWNIIGWYHDYSTTAESLGENISGTSVVTMFDPVTQTFLTHVVGTPHDNFNVERGMGLFIYTDEASYWHGEG